MKRILLLITTLILIPFSQIFAGTYSGGDGSSGTPYQIANLNDLKELCQTPGDWGAFFIQKADIDASQTQYWDDADDNSNLDLYDDPNDVTSTGNNEGFRPIGNGSTEFSGDYDGGGFTISNLYINRSSSNDIGFFGDTDGADIMNLGLINIDVTGRDYVGGLVGFNFNVSSISNCYSTGNVTGRDNVGGLVGFDNSDYFTNSFSSVIVSGSDYVGGLVGFNFNTGNILRCYSTGDVSGIDNVGGLVGYNFIHTISNCYSTGAVSGSNYVGGFVGNNTDFGTINNSYSIGDVSGNTNVGGLVGINTSTVSNSFWDITIEPTDNGIGTGKTTDEMKDFRTFTDQSTLGLTTAWDFISNPIDDAENNDYWDMDQEWDINNGYPILTWQSESDNLLAFNGGHGTSANPFQIDNYSDLIMISFFHQYWDAYFIQTSNIDATDSQYLDDTDDDSDGRPYNDPNDATSTGNNDGFSPLGNPFIHFTGDYNGDGYYISNLSINRSSSDYIGFFGYTDAAEIKQLGIINVDISGDAYVGGLIGYNYNTSSINYCYATGDISAILYVGGLIGYNNDLSLVSSCYATVTVSGENRIGGLVGINDNTSNINNSYATGEVSGFYNVGGLVGYNSNVSTISMCYSLGIVSDNLYAGGLVGHNTATVSDSFWDTQTSNQTNSAGGTGRTTSQMKDISTFAGASWNFDNIWIMGENLNDSYPALWGGFENTYEPTDIDSPSDGVINIRNIAELRWISENSSSWSNDLELDNDIDASSTLYWNVGDHDADAGTPVEPMGLSPIGTSAIRFEGDFDGNSHIIDDLYINRQNINYVALIGYSYNNNVYDLGVTNVDIYGINSTGGILGYGESVTINRLFSTGNVSGSDYVGGLSGDINGNVNSCYSLCNVSGNNYLGSLFGYNVAIINNSYARGNVSGNDIVGGFIGYNSSSNINNCYSTGQVSGNSIGGLISSNTGTVNNSFWDTETSGTSTSDGGTGKTTEEMKDVTTFLDVGWDFLDMTTNGTNDYWGINTSDNNGYPWLEWQGFINAIVPVISTVNITIIGDETAKSGGIISNEGVTSITSKGVCWNTSETPTISDNYTDDGSGDSDYDSYMTGLQVNTQYYVRAYATNSFGTGYGNEITFIYTAIPTLPEWGLIIFGGLIVVFAVRKIFRI